ncbi:hypothetical protein Cni_G08934 [Canna indica]|uniref:Uncharacterized protein n=1 Tax=Canna indica TaxID=4628 RepID=A0AAQ3K736_9LILI|nr:hypothetical protein Cni_G08934 [Canna indica]
MESFTLPSPMNKVVFILGATGSGKSKLAIYLAKCFCGEVINSDKMQVYTDLDTITNKVTEDECDGVTHHLLGSIHPDMEFTVADFRRQATSAVESILRHDKPPIIAGGSNSYIKELVDGVGSKFRSQYDCCFMWVDVELTTLHQFVAARVDKMVERGAVQEARLVFRADHNYSQGIWRSIGMAEMDSYFRAENSGANEEMKARMLEAAINEMKANTYNLTI